MDEQTNNQTPEPTDALDALMAAPESAEPVPDPVRTILLRLLRVETDLGIVARACTKNGAGVEYEDLRRIGRAVEEPVGAEADDEAS